MSRSFAYCILGAFAVAGFAIGELHADGMPAYELTLPDSPAQPASNYLSSASAAATTSSTADASPIIALAGLGTSHASESPSVGDFIPAGKNAGTGSISIDGTNFEFGGALSSGESSTNTLSSSIIRADGILPQSVPEPKAIISLLAMALLGLCGIIPVRYSRLGF
jgi:hypothetical protein